LLRFLLFFQFLYLIQIHDGTQLNGLPPQPVPMLDSISLQPPSCHNQNVGRLTLTGTGVIILSLVQAALPAPEKGKPVSNYTS
jgi:hypothetical protein